MTTVLTMATLPIRCGDGRCPNTKCNGHEDVTLCIYIAGIVGESVSPPKSYLSILLNFEQMTPVRQWTMHSEDGLISLHHHTHLFHMANFENVPYVIYFAGDASWGRLPPRCRIRIKFPGFLIIRPEGLPEAQCQGLDDLISELHSIQRSS